MAWIESHTVLTRHRKVLLLAYDLKLSVVTTIGHLHAFWYTILEQQEDGDLTEWPDALIEEAALWEGAPGEFVSKLRLRGWLDGHLVHDWLDYVGPYLTKKYHSENTDILKKIWLKHGYKYGEGKGKYIKQKGSKKEAERKTKGSAKSVYPPLPNPPSPSPSEPDLTKPNLTVVVSARERKLGELEALSLSEELQSWARQEFRVRIPDDVLAEFKAYWREQKKLRTDWIATFKSRIRQLVSWGVLKPEAGDVFDAFLNAQEVQG